MAVPNEIYSAGILHPIGIQFRAVEAERVLCNAEIVVIYHTQHRIAEEGYPLRFVDHPAQP